MKALAYFTSNNTWESYHATVETLYNILQQNTETIPVYLQIQL